MISSTQPKSGVRSTEFWVKTILQVVLLLNAALDLGIALDESAAVTIVAGLEAVYALARSIVKRGAGVTAGAGGDATVEVLDSKEADGAVADAIFRNRETVLEAVREAADEEAGDSEANDEPQEEDHA